MAFEQPCPLFLSLLLALLPFPTFAQTFSKLSLGKASITAMENSSFWASSSGDFAFGFQQIEKDGFLLAIWFNKIPERTIVWSANRDQLAPTGSKVELTSDGRFWLNDPNNGLIWFASPSGDGVAYAAMLDTGNFVLAGQDSQNLWESFDHPTDTILPGQVLNQPARLVSRYLETNYSRGRFQFVLQDDGNLVLYTTHFPLDSVNFAYWTTQVFGVGFSVVFNQSGYIFVQRSNGSVIDTITGNATSTQEFYQRAILDYDGVFRHYVYPRSSRSSAGSWPMAWSTHSSIPENICLRSSDDNLGSGVCGFNSYCSQAQTNFCRCPFGYSFNDPSDKLKGCIPNFVPQSCNETSFEKDLFYFTEMPNTDWSYSEYEVLQSVNEDGCRQACLEDCYCAVAMFSKDGCFKKSIPLKNGRINPSRGGKALIKTRKENLTMISRGTDDKTKIFGSTLEKNDRKKLIIIGSTLLSSLVVFILLAAACLVACRLGHNNPKKHQAVQVVPNMNLISFTFKELREATNGFTEELGRGSFSTVYKGNLLDIPGNLVAVKKLNTVSGSEKEFKAEVNAIGITHHRNLVQLLGFCNEGEHRLLVYEFMSKGSLASFLFEEDPRPSWYQRVQIVIGIARGLLYLHDECNSQIIHCDIKPQNVLLDDSYTAKISDFGLAKLLKIDQAVTTTAIRGTKGYVATEWFKSMPITMKVDVYSYGVLLLELICCKKNFDIKAEDESMMVLADWAYDCLHDGRLHLLVEDDVMALADIKRVERYIMIAIWCIQENPSLRPTMKQVLQMLEGFMDVPNPPEAALLC